MSQRRSSTGAGAKLAMLLLLCVIAAGCRHRRVQAPPPAPPPELEQPPVANQRPAHRGSKVLWSEIGIASWYGAPYHNARGANGMIYNQNAMTAAHRTLPMGTVVRVTNLATRQSAVVTITDRGPFVRNRILDLSRAAAIKTGVWRTGTARVRIDVLKTTQAASREGRWCVQIGVFRRAGTAKQLRGHLQHEYPEANVIDFRGATGYWVRIKPAGRSHAASEQIAHALRLAEGSAYLVRLD